MARRPTIADLAEAAGVSLATVDRVLNRRHPVREATALRVYEAARAIGYHATTLIQHRLTQERPECTLGILLQKPDQAFYRDLRAALEAAAQAVSAVRLRLIVEFLPSQNPGEVADRMIALGGRVQGLALTAIDHHRVSDAAKALSGQGVPVFSLLSDFAQGLRDSYVGIDNLRAGRTAAWMIGRGLPADGQIGLFVGGHRWHGHELRETGFRSYFREHRPEIEVLDTLVNLDTPDLAYEAMLELMARRPRLAGLYCAGGGMEGCIRAIRDEGVGRGIALVVNELTDVSRSALADGIVMMVIATPLRLLAQDLIGLMTEAARRGPTGTTGQLFLPMELHLPESL